MEAKPLIVIVGPTASGKTSLAIEIAKSVDGEIICADSRTVYKELDIGTAKPTKKEQAAVPHWGIDLVQPDQRFTAADFKEYALQKISEIRSRGGTPFLVGGTGLYIDSVIFDYQFGSPADPVLRKRLESMSIHELHKYCNDNNIPLPENDKNKRYVIRTIEQKNVNIKRRDQIIENVFVVGISTDKDELRRRIEKRANELFTEDVIIEAKRASEKYGWGNEAMTGNIYPLCREYLAGKITLGEAKQKFITLDWRLAKRQITWLKRNSSIHWCSLSEAKNYILSLLAPEQ